jgi:hypothetical protein
MSRSTRLKPEAAGAYVRRNAVSSARRVKTCVIARRYSSLA